MASCWNVLEAVCTRLSSEFIAGRLDQEKSNLLYQEYQASVNSSPPLSSDSFPFLHLFVAEHFVGLQGLHLLQSLLPNLLGRDAIPFHELLPILDKYIKYYYVFGGKGWYHGYLGWKHDWHCSKVRHAPGRGVQVDVPKRAPPMPRHPLIGDPTLQCNVYVFKIIQIKYLIFNIIYIFIDY